MVGPHLDQAQRVTRLIEIEIELSGLGLAGNLEVHVGEPAQANGGLVHKAAGLAKVAVLCKLAHLGQLDGVDGGTLPQRLHGAAVRGLDRSRAGKTAAGGNGADRGEIKARRRAPGLGQLERHAADQRGSGLALVLAYGQVAQVDLYQRKVGVDYAHHVGAVGNGHAVHGDIERAGNNVAPPHGRYGCRRFQSGRARGPPRPLRWTRPRRTSSQTARAPQQGRPGCWWLAWTILSLKSCCQRAPSLSQRACW